MNKSIIIITWGGIGDLLVCTPTLRAIKESHPDKKIIVYCIEKIHRDVLLNNPYIDSLRLLIPKYMWRYPLHLYTYLFNRSKIKYYHLFFQHVPPGWLYEKHTRDIVPEIFSDLNIIVKSKKLELYLTQKELEKAKNDLQKYRNIVLLHVHSTSSVNHHWPIDKWNLLVEQTPEFTFIQIGNSTEPSVKGAIDLRGKTTLREAFGYMKYATSFVGVDSIFGHVTNVFGIPGIVLFGDSSPIHWGHINNINIYKNIKCSPCYYYLEIDPCPYGHECMNIITVDEVKSALTQQVYGQNKYKLQHAN